MKGWFVIIRHCVIKTIYVRMLGTFISPPICIMVEKFDITISSRIKVNLGGRWCQLKVACIQNKQTTF